MQAVPHLQHTLSLSVCAHCCSVMSSELKPLIAPASGVAVAGRHLQCAVCKESVSKYACPRCQLRTCSLGCTQQHRKSQGCSGKRQHSQLATSKTELDEATVRADYHFLQAASQHVGNSRRFMPRSRPALPTQV